MIENADHTNDVNVESVDKFVQELAIIISTIQQQKYPVFKMIAN
jgi:hypothetical protein